jgi:hypothetical protein
MADLQPGSIVTIAADIMINGVLTFAGGEQVTVQQVSPNPQMPEYKYTVQSARNGNWYQLRDADVMGAPPPQPQQAPQYAQQQYAQPGAPQPGMQPAARAGGGGGELFAMMETSDWMVGIGGIVMFLGAFFYLWGFGYLFPLLGLALAVLVVLDKIAKVDAIANWPYLAWVYIISGGLTTLLGAISLLRLFLWLHGLPVSTMWYFTPIIELAASIVILVGGIMRVREGM